MSLYMHKRRILTQLCGSEHSMDLLYTVYLQLCDLPDESVLIIRSSRQVCNIARSTVWNVNDTLSSFVTFAFYKKSHEFVIDILFVQYCAIAYI